MLSTKIKIKNRSRLRTKIRIKKRMEATDVKPRISVFRSSKYTSAQVISDTSGKTIAAASTREKAVMEVAASLKLEGATSSARSSKSICAAKALGQVLTQRLKEKGVEQATFDRNGFLYHGRVKAVADGAREAGLKV